MRFLLFIVVLGLSIGCRSAQKDLDKGRYTSAIEKSIKKLKKRKDIREHKSILNTALQGYYDETMIELQKAKTIEQRESALQKFLRLEDYFIDGQAYLDESNKQRKEDTSLMTDDLQEEVIASLYDRGMQYLNQAIERDDKLLAQKAHRELLHVFSKYNPNIPEIKDNIEQAYQLALYVVSFQVDMNFNYSLRSDVERRFDDMEGTNGYNVVYVNRQIPYPDCLIELDFSSLDERQYQTTNNRSFSKQIEDGYTTQRDSTGKVIQIPKYKTVSAQVQIVEIRYTMEWQMAADIEGGTRHCSLRNRNFRRNVEQIVTSYQINGDSRAVPAEYTQNNNRYDRSRLLNDLIELLYQDIVSSYLRT